MTEQILTVPLPIWFSDVAFPLTPALSPRRGRVPSQIRFQASRSGTLKMRRARSDSEIP